MSEHVQTVTKADFQQKVIEESNRRPVLVDFWATWCGPCRALTPILEKLAAEYGGRIVVAKVNTDENQDLAQQFGVRGIPNVKAFYGGSLTDEFTGALPEGMVRQFIERVLPSPSEELRVAAMKAFASGQAQEALVGLEKARSLDPDSDAIRIDCAEVLISLGRGAEAAALLDELKPLAAMEPRVQHLKAQLTFAGTGAETRTTTELENQIASAPDDLGARLQLAKSYVSKKQYEPALQQLLEVVRTDRRFGDDAGRKTMLAVFELLGSDHPLTSQYRRQLAASLN